MIGSENDVKIKYQWVWGRKTSNYWASATVTVMLRKGGGQSEITEGVIAGSSFDVITQSSSPYTWHRKMFPTAGILWIEKLRHGAQFSYLSWSSIGLHCLFPFPLLSVPLPVFYRDQLKPGFAQQRKWPLVIGWTDSLWRESSTKCKRRKASDTGGTLGFSCLEAFSILENSSLLCIFSPKSACLYNFMHSQVLSLSFKFCLPFTLH